MDDLVLRQNVAKFIRMYIGREHTSLRKYSKKVGVHYKTLETLSQGRGNPRLSTFIKIAKSANISLNDLFFKDWDIYKLPKI